MVRTQSSQAEIGKRAADDGVAATVELETISRHVLTNMKSGLGVWLARMGVAIRNPWSIKFISAKYFYAINPRNICSSKIWYYMGFNAVKTKS